MTASTTTSVAPSKGLHIGLWVAQVLLAVAFGMAGAMKTFTPLDELAQTLPWVAESGAGLVRFIGVSELAGALGLILPAATRIKPSLTALAALGLVVVMVLAAGFHVMRGEAQALPVNLVLGGLAAFVAWGRWKKQPIAPRS
jgi:predicted tellurium resistance membrane protein TerC